MRFRRGAVGIHWPRSDFLRSVALMSGGTAAAQAITVALSPVLTRLYGPEALGILGLFLAFVALMTPLSGLTYGMALVLPAADHEARALLRLSLIIGFGISAAISIPFGLFHQSISAALDLAIDPLALLLMPIVMVVLTPIEPLQQWLIRVEAFDAIAKVAIVVAAATGLGIVAAAPLFNSAAALLVLTTFGLAMRALLLWRSARTTLAAGGRRDDPVPVHEAPASLLTTARRYRDFPLFRAPQVGLNGLSQNLPTLLLAAFFDPAAAGYFMIARRALALPATLIGCSVGAVLLPRLARADHQGERLRPMLLQTTAALALVGLVPFGCLIAFGPALFALVFGHEWEISGHFARWLSLWLYVMFLNSPAVQAVPLLGLQKHMLAFEVLNMVLRAAAILIGAFGLQSAVAAVILFSLTSMVINLVFIASVLVASDRVVPGARVADGG